MADRLVTAEREEVLDALLWRTAGLGAAALAIVLAANPDLAELGVLLPIGQTVLIPEAAQTPDVEPLVQLWS